MTARVGPNVISALKSKEHLNLIIQKKLFYTMWIREAKVLPLRTLMPRYSEAQGTLMQKVLFLLRDLSILLFYCVIFCDMKWHNDVPRCLKAKFLVHILATFCRQEFVLAYGAHL